MPHRLLPCIFGIGIVGACARPEPNLLDTGIPLGTGGGTETSQTEVGVDTGSPPSNPGLLVFHRYTSYDAWDSVLLMLDLADYSLTEVSKDWDIDHAMNAHFSPDGTQLVFMGDQHGGDRDWDVFLWTIGSTEPPENLTKDWGTRDEDPKFTPEGTIVCKSNFDLIELDQTGTVLATLTSDGLAIEQSMPFATTDGSQVIYAQGAGAASDLHRIGRDGTCLLYTSPSPRDGLLSRMPSSA